MLFPKSIRWRLQLWHGALLVAVLCGFGVTAYQLERARQFRRIDAGLQDRVSLLVDALRGGPERGPERKPTPTLRLSPAQAAMFGGKEGYYFAIWMQPAEPILLSPEAPRNIAKPASGDAVTRMRGDLRESFLFAAPVNCLLVGRSITSEQAELRTLAAALAAVGGTVLAIGLIGGGWLVSRAIRPIGDISTAAAQIAAGDLTRRIDIAETDGELGQLAAVLNSTFARLETAFAQQARFTADAAHELRTPVAVILTQTQSALARERSSEEYRETLEACQRATQRMRRLIDSLLELARLDAGQEPIARQPCDLSKVAAECVDLIHPLARARQIALHTDLATAPCVGDAERLAQVITNLISNAIEYNHDGGEVRIITGHDSGSAQVTVANTGPGIPPADLSLIFERFHRADKARTAGHSGLGLAIARSIVQAHGGSIEAASEPGHETTFTVRLFG